MTIRKYKEWTPAELALLGTASDKDIARKVGRSPASVMQKRHKLGVPSFGFRSRIRTWGPIELLLFEQHDDVTIARITLRSLKDVMAKREALKQRK